MDRKFNPMPALDLIGDIAIVDISYVDKDKWQEIISSILDTYHKRVNIIANKTGKTKGKFRIQPLEIIFGDDRLSTIHKEFGCNYSLDLSKVFFSSRLAYERKRIAELVNRNETILVCFAGVGPFAIMISKHSDAREIIGIEINEDAYEFFEQNISLNKTKNVKAIMGDVKDVLQDKKYDKYFDRIIMPHPFGDTKFLEYALKVCKRGGVIHYYDFGHRNDVFEIAQKYIEDSAKEHGCRIQILNKKIVRPTSAGIVHVVLDLKIE